MTRDEIERFLGELHYDRDDREAPDNYRRGQFKTGWEDWTVRHETYTVDTLLCLTWHNLGYRFGQRFGGRSADEITEVYEVIADLYGVPEAGEGITLRGEVEDESVLLEGVVTGKEIRVVTWNTHRRSPSILSALDSGRPDIVTLQEVTQEQAEAFRARLAKMGLTNAIYTGIAEAEKRYGNVIASRWPVTAVPIPEELRGKIPWPQLLGHAAIDVEGRQAHVITAHIPNGSGNGWAKIDTFHALAEIMRSLKGQPCILTGDFNEPRYALQDGKIVTFGQDRRSNGRYTCWSHWSFNGERRAGEEWDKAVRWFFEVQNNHGLRHAFWAACGRCKTAVTHRSHGSPRWFDHIFVSDDFEVRTCTYIHDVRLKGFSDHSALVTQLAVRKNNALH